MLAVPKLEKAREILNDVPTSGIKAQAAKLVKFLGLPGHLADTTDLTVLQKQLGGVILEELQKLTGPKSDFEYQQVESMNATIRGDSAANKQILDQMIEAYMSVIEEGAVAADSMDDAYVRRKYARWRDKHGKARPSQDAETPGGSRENPLHVGAGDAKPAAGTWVKLPSGQVRQVQ